MKLKNIFLHLRKIVVHRYWVRHYCFMAGLYWQGITHDLSKYSPTEFWESVKYYQGASSPIIARKKDKGYSMAWFHHRGRNKHHWEYWIDAYVTGGHGCIMPFKYACEMICDMIAASKVYKGDEYTLDCPLKYFKAQTYGRFVHPQIQAFMNASFTAYANEGTAAITKERLFSFYKQYVN